MSLISNNGARPSILDDKINNTKQRNICYRCAAATEMSSISQEHHYKCAL